MTEVALDISSRDNDTTAPSNARTDHPALSRLPSCHAIKSHKECFFWLGSPPFSRRGRGGIGRRHARTTSLTNFSGFERFSKSHGYRETDPPKTVTSEACLMAYPFR